MDMIDFISREKARGDCYRLLSVCFYQPERDLFLQEDLFGNLASRMQQVCPAASAAAGELEKAFSECSEEELTVDYARLFVGPHELLAPPFGSVYLDGERKVMGNSTLEVIDMYEAQGIVMDSEFKNLPDHITAELEFMHYLIHQETKTLQLSDIAGTKALLKIQEHFLNRHLKRWIPPFCDNMQGGADCRFYTLLAACTSLFVGGDGAGEELPGELQHKKASD
jgi:TorA maturation chaperone TorD